MNNDCTYVLCFLFSATGSRCVAGLCSIIPTAVVANVAKNVDTVSTPNSFPVWAIATIAVAAVGVVAAAFVAMKSRKPATVAEPLMVAA